MWTLLRALFWRLVLRRPEGARWRLSTIQQGGRRWVFLGPALCEGRRVDLWLYNGANRHWSRQLLAQFANRTEAFEMREPLSRAGRRRERLWFTALSHSGHIALGFGVEAREALFRTALARARRRFPERFDANTDDC